MTQLVETSGGLDHAYTWEMEKRRLRRDGFLLKHRFGYRFRDMKKGCPTQRSVRTRRIPLSSKVLSVAVVESREDQTDRLGADVSATNHNDCVFHESTTLCTQIGGLRQDPFNMLPITSTGYIPSAWDYCEFLHPLLPSFLSSG